MAALEANPTEEAYIAACLERGATGVFLATQFAGDNLLTAAEHHRWCAPFDARLLGYLRGRSEFSLMHLHGQTIVLDRFIRYPVPALSWEDGSLTMADGRRRFAGVVVGGLDRDGWVVAAPPEVVRTKTRALLQETDRAVRPRARLCHGVPDTPGKPPCGARTGGLIWRWPRPHACHFAEKLAL